ncbi:MAG: hypothetical protein DI586_04910, partial [Micavibrio aeruginosavorus]
KYITRSDWLFLSASVFTIPVWLLTRNPQIALLWLLVIELLATVPTFRKAYALPNEMDPRVYLLSSFSQATQFAAVYLR